MKARFRLLACFLFLLFLPTALNHGFLWSLHAVTDIVIQKKPIWMWRPGFIHLKPALIEWPGEFKVVSGDVEVVFPLYAVLGWVPFPITLTGKDIEVEVSDRLKSAIGQDRIVFDRFSAQIKVRPGSDMDIGYLDAESKTVQFHLKQQ